MDQTSISTATALLLAKAAWGLVVSVFGFLGVRAYFRFDAQGASIETLKRETVTRKELADLFHEFSENGRVERATTNANHMRMHDDYLKCIDKINARIEASDAEARISRTKMLDDLHGLALHVATVIGRCPEMRDGDKFE